MWGCQTLALPSPPLQAQCMAQRPPWEGKARTKVYMYACVCVWGGPLPRAGAGLSTAHTAWRVEAQTRGSGDWGTGSRLFDLSEPQLLSLGIGYLFLGREILRNVQKWNQVKYLAQCQALGKGSEDVSFLPLLCAFLLKLSPGTCHGNYQVEFFMQILPSYKAGIWLLSIS